MRRNPLSAMMRAAVLAVCAVVALIDNRWPGANMELRCRDGWTQVGDPSQRIPCAAVRWRAQQ